MFDFTVSTLSAKEISPFKSKIQRKRKVPDRNDDTGEVHFSKDEVIQVESDETIDEDDNHLGDIPVALQVGHSHAFWLLYYIIWYKLLTTKKSQKFACFQLIPCIKDLYSE